MEKEWNNLTLLEISSLMKNEQAAFIVGCPRSGSTLLYRILQRHSNYSPDPENLSEAEILHFANSSHLFSATYPPVARYYMNEDEEYWQAFLKVTSPIRFLHRWTRLPALVRLSNRHIGFWKLCGNAFVVRAFFYCAKEARGGKRVLEKTNYYIHHLDKLASAFPHARFLAIHRHPIDTYTSYLRRGTVENRPWLKKTKEQFCDLWESNMSAIKENSERVFSISYDELTRVPESTFRRICYYLGVAFEVGALEEPNPDLERLKVDPYLYAPIQKNTKTWHDFLSEEDGKWIEERLKSIMDDFGYASYTESAA